MEKKIYFTGVLANVDSSILHLNLNHGFKIEAISMEEAISLISTLEGGLPTMEVGNKIYMEFPCLNDSERKLYIIINSFEGNIEMNNNGVLESFPSEVFKFNNTLIQRYLYPFIQLMRLFKEGDIRMPLNYYYIIDNNIPKSILRGAKHRHISREPYRLESSELSDLQKFIRETKLPFKKSFLQLAFENFELSYETVNMSLSFLALMGSLETLFNPGMRELRYRISRNAAVLLGKDIENSMKIFSEIKDLYDKRSTIIHTGKSKRLKKEDLLKLRHYVRESIKEIYKFGKNKDELLDLLNSCGFGDRVNIKR